MIWTSVFALLLTWGIYCFSKHDFPSLWPLVVLRSMANLSAGVLFIPLLQMLLTFSDCTHSCNAVISIIYLSFSTLAAAFLSAISLLFVGVYYDSDIWSREMRAQAHGRLNIVIISAQLALVISFNSFGLFTPILRIGMLTVVGCVWAFAVLFFMPYFSHTVNRLLAGGAFFFLGGVVALSFNYYLFDIMNASILFYLIAPLCAVLGASLADARANNIACAPVERMNSPYEVELKARYMLHQFLFGHATLKQHRNARDSDGDEREGASKAARLKDRDMEEGANNKATGVRQRATALHSHDRSSDHVNSGDQRTLNSDEIAELLDLYRSAATRRFAESSVMHLFCSRFFGNVLRNRHLQMSHLLQADRCSPAIDIAFTIFQSRRALEIDASKKSGSSSANAGALSRASFDRHASEARRFVRRAAAHQLSFWGELNEVTPNLSRLHILSLQTNEAVRSAEQCFSEIFIISPQAIAQLRLYAVFNLHVTGDAEKATALLSEAERVEDSLSKEHRTEAGSHLDILTETHLDVWSDSTAIVTTSNNIRDLGVITTINAGESVAGEHSDAWSPHPLC